MSLWSRLTGGAGKSLSDAELAAEGDAFLRETEQQIVVDTKKAMKRMFNRPKRLEPLFDFGRPLHERFADLVLKGAFLKNRSGGTIERTCRDLPSVKIVSDGEAATVGDAYKAAAGAEDEIIFFRFLKDWPPDVLAAVEALYEMAVDSSALFIIHAGPDNVFIRKDYLVSAASALDSSAKMSKLAEQLFLHGEAQDGTDYDDYVLSAHGYAFTKFFRKHA